MATKKVQTNEIDAYIAGFPKDTQKLLQQLRETIITAAPDAEEIISYKMPAYKYFGMLAYFAAHPNHIGFYPTPSAIENFKKEISVYKWATGSVQFPVDKLLPLKLITKMVTFKVKENLEKADTKKKK